MAKTKFFSELEKTPITKAESAAGITKHQKAIYDYISYLIEEDSKLNEYLKYINSTLADGIEGDVIYLDEELSEDLVKKLNGYADTFQKLINNAESIAEELDWLFSKAAKRQGKINTLLNNDEIL